MILISKYQAEKIKAAMKFRQQTCKTSLDLGITQIEVKIVSGHAILDKELSISEAQIDKIIKNDTSVFLITDKGIEKIQIFSEETNKFYKLMPTGYKSPPTLEISGIRMHLTKDMNPHEDTKNKISCISPVSGRILDCNMGLGYTAIMASEKAQVDTCEIDPNVIEIARFNPWSSRLFLGNIKIHNQDVFEKIKDFKDCSFDAIIHDPPSFKLSVHLYSKEFYSQLYRVMKPKGKLYHYTGMPGSKARGMDIMASTSKKLADSGFRQISMKHRGIIAIK